MRFIDQARALLDARAGERPTFHLSLALQGGGSFGAFTWGALDRLLEEDDIKLDAISGASAGAVNAVLMAAGLIEGGREGARKKLAQFWRRMSDAASFLPISSVPPGLEALARAMSPYHFNPFDLNPLRDALATEVDFARLSRESSLRLLIAATRVSDGALRIFRNEDLSVDAVLASACLPLIHRTVEIDGEGYWDGGYAANPPLIRLVQESDALDVLVVQVTPSKVVTTPKSKTEIVRRLEQINFNATLNCEIEALKLGASLRATPKLRELRIDLIAAQDEIDDLATRNAGDLGWSFLESLRNAGRRAVETWLAERSTEQVANARASTA
jgi:NTE family protein